MLVQSRLFTWMAVGVALAVAAYFGARWVKIQTILAADVLPFTVISEESGYATNPDGTIRDPNPRGRAAYARVRRSDGSVANVTFDRDAWKQGQHVFELRDIVRVDESKRISIFDLSKVQSAFNIRPNELAAVKSKPRDPTCMTHPEQVVTWQYLGRGSVLGLEVVKHRLDLPGSSVVTESWQAPSLDCERLFLKSTFRNSKGEFTDTTIRTAVRIDQAEPDARYFASIGAREVKPSEALLAEINRKAPQPLGSLPEKLARKAEARDADYLARKSN